MDINKVWKKLIPALMDDLEGFKTAGVWLQMWWEQRELQLQEKPEM